MVEVAGTPDRLCPHIKTTKMPEVVRLYRDAGVRKFKCATTSEASIVAGCGDGYVLLAIQPVGPNVEQFLQLQETYPSCRFATLVDSADAVQRINKLAHAKGTRAELWLDVNVGMNRTGIVPGEDAIEVCRQITDASSLDFGGLHVYDGHIHDSDIAVRKSAVDRAFVPVREFVQRLAAMGIAVPDIVAGGTPSFPIHAESDDLICSPGTTVFWDQQSSDHFPDMEFQFAALVLCRVISKPTETTLCLDLGHKAVASEMSGPRVRFFGFEDAKPVGHSEEHLVIETSQAPDTPIGAELYGVPTHICPTVALHEHAWVVENGKATTTWHVAARRRDFGLTK